MTRQAIGSHQSARMLEERWLTPPGIIGALGPFGLDPCAAPEPRPWPTAARHITRPDDGLAADWGQDRVFLNPPSLSELGDLSRDDIDPGWPGVRDTLPGDDEQAPGGGQ
jgi:hypothetical protein